MPPFRKSLNRSVNQWKLWQEFQLKIDRSPEIPPCTNFPDLFFGDAHAGAAMGDIAAAKKMCKPCPLKFACAAYAIEAEEEYGVWGGLSVHERNKLRKTHGSSRQAAEVVRLLPRRTRSNGVQTDKR